MTTKWTKGLLVAAAVLGLLSLGAAGAWADYPNTGQFIIKIKPTVDLGVLVETTGTGWDAKWSDGPPLDNEEPMDLGTEKLLATGVKVTVKGNFQNQELELQGQHNSTWLLATDETPTENKLRLYAMFSKEAETPLVTGDFGDATTLITEAGPTVVGQSVGNEGSGSPGTGHICELADTHGQYGQMDDMAVDQVRRLWRRA